MTSFKVAALAFWLGVGIHGIDHLVVRGLFASPVPVIIVGVVQLIAVNIAVWLAITDRVQAPAWAVGTGLASAVLFTLAHVLPEWWFLSDSFLRPVSPGVTWFSWVTAAAEILTALGFAVVGLQVMRERAKVAVP
jgi:hypothetical protein